MSRLPVRLPTSLQRLVLVATLTVAVAGAEPVASTAAAVEVPVTIMGAGDIGGSLIDAGSTGDLIRAMNPDAVFTTGDQTHSDGTSAQYATKYDPPPGAPSGRRPGRSPETTTTAPPERQGMSATSVPRT